MSDEEQSEGGDVAVAAAQDSENTVLKTLMAEIEKLKIENKLTKQALAAVMVRARVRSVLQVRMIHLEHSKPK